MLTTDFRRCTRMKTGKDPHLPTSGKCGAPVEELEPIPGGELLGGDDSGLGRSRMLYRFDFPACRSLREEALVKSKNTKISSSAELPSASAA
jgi:hypothetical protein